MHQGWDEPKSSSNRSPNHCSKTSISASVTGTGSGQSSAGVAAKLDAVLREGNIWEDGSEFPWPQIRSALDDLARIGRHGGNGVAP